MAWEKTKKWDQEVTSSRLLEVKTFPTCEDDSLAIFCSDK